MPTSTPFTADTTVNTVLTRLPASAEVFNAFGVDACCGGAASLDSAAREAHVEIDTLLAALASVAHQTPYESRAETAK